MAAGEVVVGISQEENNASTATYGSSSAATTGLCSLGTTNDSAGLAFNVAVLFYS